MLFVRLLVISQFTETRDPYSMFCCFIIYIRYLYHFNKDNVFFFVYSYNFFGTAIATNTTTKFGMTLEHFKNMFISIK